MAVCAYCNKRPGAHRDHLITRNQARRSPKAQAARSDPRFIVRCCVDDNWLKGTRLLVPPSHEHLIPELEALTHGKYRVWEGDREALHEVVR